ncbi:SymE family type I addiction module toxin [Niabella beijingensis]|uniref:SymE family type I addiction module toxin n=1 Tax=Niabella beijingensis TaxID=2872700 RepID=UPI001CBC75E8|nr:SymE family type I addiction module toxin [Niabella beijingensis]MBZ4189282.1 type I toxin-antitoxin system SymE family toxin [Niabella beijingensis]
MAIIATMKNSATIKRMRKLKIYDRAIVYNSTLWSGYIINHYPEIRLMGKWLLDCGFKCGQHIDITIAENKLIIVPACFEPERG